MGIFDEKVDQKVFDKFQAALESKINYLEQEIKLKVTDSEEIAHAAAENAVNLETKIKASEASVTSILAVLETCKNISQKTLQEIQTEKDETLANNSILKESIANTLELHERLLKSQEKADAALAEIAENVAKINGFLEESKDLPETVGSTRNLLDESKTIGVKIQDLLDHSVKRKGEIDDLFKAIYGHDVAGSEGNVEHVDGLKDVLERAYKNVARQTNELSETVKKSVDTITDEHKVQLSAQSSTFEKLVDDSNNRITSVSDQLTGLLPGAMAEGLSAAYEKKKDDEIASLTKFDSTFKWAILGMVAVSLIPFLVDVYLLGAQGKDLVQVIKDTPSLIVAIFPLYFPVLWLAYSSNKKVNLSKRLIEEYTHKAVLGKTFSGLANQIESLPHEGLVKEELRTRLLFNVLQVSSENPGKLISNYSKSDHPLMDAMENSAKLSDSFEVLSKIPGLSAFVEKLAAKSENLLRVQTDKVEKGLKIGDSLGGAPDKDATPS